MGLGFYSLWPDEIQISVESWYLQRAICLGITSIQDEKKCASAWALGRMKKLFLRILDYNLPSRLSALNLYYLHTVQESWAPKSKQTLVLGCVSYQLTVSQLQILSSLSCILMLGLDSTNSSPVLDDTTLSFVKGILKGQGWSDH